MSRARNVKVSLDPPCAKKKGVRPKRGGERCGFRLPEVASRRPHTISRDTGCRSLKEHDIHLTHTHVYVPVACAGRTHTKKFRGHRFAIQYSCGES